MRDRPTRPAGPPPDEGSLREAALTHLARFGTTEAGLVRVLDRRIDRWVRRAADEAGTNIEPAATAAAREAAREAARRVASALAASGAVDDGAFASARARRLGRAGRSRQAVASHLAAKGVAPELARAVLPDEESELAAAVVQARRRRIGPFRPSDADADPVRELAALARAGFGQSVARTALNLEREEAAAILERLKRDGPGGPGP